MSSLRRRGRGGEDEEEQLCGEVARGVVRGPGPADEMLVGL